MATIKKGLKKAQEGEKLGLTYTTPRGKKYSLPQGAAGPLKITRPNGSTRTIEDREKYTRKMRRVVDRNTVNGVRQGTMEREKNGGSVKKAQRGKKLTPETKKKTGMDALKDLGKYVSTGGLATEKYNPAPSTKATKKMPKKVMKNGGSLSALNASNKRDRGIDPTGAFTTVQKKALAGAKGKASLTKDKQLGATKMAKRGMSIKKK